MSEESVSAAVEPADAFGVLADDTRLAILRALGGADDPLPFSELYELVDVADSGQFNYHLDKLTGHFARKTDDGYELTTAGKQTHSAILSGAYTDSVDLDPLALDSRCPVCDAALELTYSEEIMAVTCPDCADTLVRFPVPPAAVEGRSHESLSAVFDRYVRTAVEQTIGGLCPLCTGPTVPEFGLESWPDGDEPAPVVDFDCERCGAGLQLSPAALALSHPAVVAFYRDHGVDVRDRPIWQFPWVVDSNATVLTEDPLTVAITVTHDDDVLELYVDADVTVHETDPTEG